MHQIELARCDDVRRKNVDNISQRAQQNAFFQKKFVQVWPQRRKVPGIVCVELDCGNCADTAYIAYGRMFFQKRKALPVNRRNRSDSLQDRLSLKNAQTGSRSRRGQRITRIRMPMKESAVAVAADEGLLNKARASGGSHGQESPGQSLGQAHQIRRDTSNIAGKHASTTPEPGQDLVCNQQNMVAGA